MNVIAWLKFELAYYFVAVQHIIDIQHYSSIYLSIDSKLCLIHPISYSLFLSLPIYIYISKVGDLSRGWSEGSLFDSSFTEVYERVLLHSLDCSTLPLIVTLKCWVLSKAASSSIFWVFGMTTCDWTPVSRTIGKHTNSLGQWPGNIYIYIYIYVCVCVCVYIYIHIYIYIYI